MGKPGKKAGDKLQPPTKVTRQVDVGKHHLRDQRTVKRLKMYTSKVVRNEKGEITKGSVLSAGDKVQTSMARVAPDRRWFGNTRVIGQEALQQFRTEMTAKYHDPYSVVVRQSKLPLSLLEEPKNKLLQPKREMQWESTFGKKATRKRVRLPTTTVDDFANKADERRAAYATAGDEKDRNLVKPEADSRVDNTNNRSLFKKGQSNRIWNELYKVIDSADVICYVLDARDPVGTRSTFVEEYMRKEKKYKHFVFILNKTDLIPLWATARWLQMLSQDFPTVAFHASIEHPFGKGNLISLLRQFSRLHNVAHRGSKRTKTPISVGIIGYPNSGKSSVINTLRRKKVCKVAPLPGETKIWQYVALTRSIFLIDCPGIVYDREGNTDVNAVLKGVVRVERLGAADKTDVIHTVFEVCKHKDIIATYGITSWTDPENFLGQLAVKRGKLLPGGVADTDNVARSVLYDWQRGKIPWFNPPPFTSDKDQNLSEARPDQKHMKQIEKLNALNLINDQIHHGESESESEADAEEGGEEAEGSVPAVDKKKRKKATAEQPKAAKPFSTIASVKAEEAKDEKRAAQAARRGKKPVPATVSKEAAKEQVQRATDAKQEADAWDKFMSA
jgi:nuclear GTP-binding protein